MNQKDKVIIFGASGHAKVVIDIIEKQGASEVMCLIDDNLNLKGQEIYECTVAGGKEEIGAQKCKNVLVAIGENKVREKVAHWLEMNNFILFEAAVHPSAQLARGVEVGRGSTIMAGSIINSDSRIGKNTIINTSATIDHDCVIGETVHIAPSSTVCGGVSIGNLSLIGAGATILPNVKIGENVIVAAGATVINDVADNLTVVGTPAEVVL